MSRFTICYDIAHSRRRAQVARVLLEYGRRIQFSVFEVSLEPEELRELRWRVGSLLAKADRFDIIPTDTRRPEQRISWQREPYPASEIVLIGPFPDVIESPPKK
jgi:CRISPR-associated protein Cas2